jgi:Flp pilus assembly protein TadD
MTSTFSGDRDPRGNLLGHLSAVEAALRAGDLRQAMQIALDAVSRGFEHPSLLILASHFLTEGEQAEKALAFAQRARQLAPKNIDALNAEGISLTALGRVHEATSVLKTAVEMSPETYITHRNLALAHEQAGELKAARAHFLRAVELQPRDGECLTRVAHLAALRGDIGEAREFGVRALAADPLQAFAGFALATADIAEKNYDQAEKRLQALAKDASTRTASRAVALSMLGDVSDARGRYADAFGFYVEAGDNLRRLHAARFEIPGQVRAVEFARKIAEYFEKTAENKWRAQSSDSLFGSPMDTHVFLVGFPRSGTTLLGQILAAHPQIEVMEERTCLRDGLEFMRTEGSLDALAQLDDEGLAPLRAAYWRRVQEEAVPLDRPVFIDKLPLNAVLLCLVARLFPRAKILFALRDPRDVVFSCFRRRFGMTSQMYELLTLESAARYYDAVMTLCELYRRKLGLEFRDVRHETLVAGFPGEVRAVCAFLNIPFDERVDDFAQLAAYRHIDTPSAAQVVRGLSTGGIGHWRHYENAMSKVMPLLAPWIERFEYRSG